MPGTPSSLMPRSKRLFDIAVALIMILALLPVLLLCAAALLVLEGRPVLYRSKRRTYRDQIRVVVKFRTMRRDADKIINRDCVPVEGVRFLNIPISSPAYTPVGRLIERSMLTEMPQLFHVLAGTMTLVGNRPLPQNVVESLRAVYPDAESRFRVPAGLTGPTQLIGRDSISDADRLTVEIAYCDAVLSTYSMRTDLKILGRTVMLGVRPKLRLSVDQVLALLTPPAPRVPGWRAPLRLVRRPAASPVTPQPHL